ncbi:hypothetical protein B0H12DRAFT_1071116 [Mycena haematopus]|nr:hypothetical protein B0H12DRAFT_1071116 [Mycena haematopus]
MSTKTNTRLSSSSCNAFPPSYRPPAPEIVIDHDDGDPPSSRQIGLISRSETPMPAVVSHASLSSVPPPACERLRSTTWNLPAGSTQQHGRSNTSVSLSFSSSSTRPFLASSSEAMHRRSASPSRSRHSSRKSKRFRTGEESRDVDTAARADKREQKYAEGNSVSNNSRRCSRSRNHMDRGVVASEIGRPPRSSRKSIAHAESRSKEPDSRAIAGLRNMRSSSRSPYPVESIPKEYGERGIEPVEPAKRCNDKYRASGHTKEHDSQTKNGSCHMRSSSCAPYPAASIPKEYDELGIDSVKNAKRRDDKHRASRHKSNRGLEKAATTAAALEDVKSSDDDLPF